jgi:hypothetical protein
VDRDWLSHFFSWQLAAWSAFLLNAVAFFKIRNERKRDINVEKSGDWDRLRAERDRLQDLLTECHRDLAESRNNEAEFLRRAVTAEATLQGFGEWRQMQAVREAAKRLAGPEDDK